MSRAAEWVKIRDLKKPFNDAFNYKSKHEKQFFNRIFLKTDELKQCLSPSVYYLMGEKGAGKTAYAVYLENNEIDNFRCKVTTMTETQYKRFIELKKQGKLSYSDYANIWRSMLLFIASQMLVEKSKNFLHSFTGKFAKVEKAIDKWNRNALNPEVESAFEALNSELLAAKMKNDLVGEASGEQKSQSTEKSSFIRHHLLETESSLKESLTDLKLTNSHVLFIDGIDYRPESVPYHEYLECIKGLGEAVWQLNTDFFNTIKDSKGRIKIVLLVRPDVFHALNLYNSNSRLHDNTVFLDWSTTYREFKNGKLYEVGGRYFSSQQNFMVNSEGAWNHYFESAHHAETTFKRFLKISFQKPRDLLTFIRIARERYIKNGQGERTAFSHTVLSDPSFTREYSDYLLGEVGNYAAFYMTKSDFSHYLKLFQYLNGKSSFSMPAFEDAYDKFKAWTEGEDIKAKEYLRDADSLLQFFFDVNVIGYKETAENDGEEFYHWSYRERSLNNISPKVKTTGTLILNPGIAKVLDIGKRTSDERNKVGNRSSERKRSVSAQQKKRHVKKVVTA